MKKSASVFGLIGGGLVIVYSFILLVTFGNFENIPLEKLGVLEVMGYLNYLILILAIFFAMRAQKKEWIESAQSKKYMDIVKIGLIVSAIIAVFVGIGEAIYISINPDFYDQYCALMAKKYAAEGTPEKIANMQQFLENFSWVKTPLGSGVFYGFQSFVLGAVIAFIFGIFMRQKNTVVPAQA